MRRKRKVLERYLGVKEEEGLEKALKKLEEDKNLLPRSTYYWIRKKLVSEHYIDPIKLGKSVIYEIDEETKILTFEKVAEALDIVVVMSQKALLEFLYEMTKDGKKEEEKMAMGIIKTLLGEKNAENYLEVAIESYENGLIDGALGVLEVLNLAQFITPKSNEFQSESNELQKKKSLR